MRDSPRLAINGYFLDQTTTGSGQYLWHLLRYLGDLWEGEGMVLCPSTHALQCAQEVLTASGRPLEWQAVLVRPPLPGHLGKVWFEQRGVPAACRRLGADLLHVPYFGPPLAAPCPVVVTVHDLIPLVVPQARGSPPVRWYTTLAAAGAKRASHIIADSYWTKNDLCRVLHIPWEQVTVVYLACDPRFQPRLPLTPSRKIQERYGLGPGYALYLGGLDWRKNVPTLIRAFSRASFAGVLAIVGEPRSSDRRNFPDLHEVAEAAGVTSRVRFLGWVPEEDKPDLYAGASLFIYPSRYEGFGLPPLEAMACGTPVLCSKAASLPEVVGDAPLLFDPDDEEELVRLISRVSSEPALRQELRQRGLQRSRHFHWRTTAQQTAAIFQEVLQGAD